MILNARERQIIIAGLPDAGTREEMRLADAIESKLEIPQAELRAMADAKQLEPGPKGWDFVGEKLHETEREIELTEAETEYLEKVFRAMAEQGRWPRRADRLWDLFVGEDDASEG